MRTIETEILAEAQDFAGLPQINRGPIAGVEAVDSAEIPESMLRKIEALPLADG